MSAPLRPRYAAANVQDTAMVALGCGSGLLRPAFRIVELRRLLRNAVRKSRGTERSGPVQCKL